MAAYSPKQNNYSSQACISHALWYADNAHTLDFRYQPHAYLSKLRNIAQNSLIHSSTPSISYKRSIEQLRTPYMRSFAVVGFSLAWAIHRFSTSALMETTSPSMMQSYLPWFFSNPDPTPSTWDSTQSAIATVSAALFGKCAWLLHRYYFKRADTNLNSEQTLRAQHSVLLTELMTLASIPCDSTHTTIKMQQILNEFSDRWKREGFQPKENMQISREISLLIPKLSINMNGVNIDLDF